MLKIILFASYAGLFADTGSNVIIKPSNPIIGQEAVFEFQNKKLPMADKLQISYNSEFFQVPEPGSNLLAPTTLPAGFNCRHLEENPQRRSRTEVKFECSSPQNIPFSPESISFKTQVPPTALHYNVELKLFLSGKEISRQKASFKASPQNSAFVSCQLLERPKTLLACRAIDAHGNLAEDPVTISGELPGILPATYYNFKGSLDITLDSRPKPEQRFHYLWQNIHFVSNALPKKSRPVFFGDIHMHSMFSDAYVPVTPAGLFDYAKNVSLLDFAAITDHTEGVWGYPISPDKIELTRKMVQNNHQPPFFTTFLGFEWTHSFEEPDSIWGHRNIIYPDTNGLFFRADLPEYNTPAKLYRHTGPVLSFIHHTMMPWGDFRWDQPVQLHYERGVEVVSAHGSAEGPPYTMKHLPKHENPSLEGSLQNMIHVGLNMKFMASSDCHSGHPGLNDWHGFIKPVQLDGGGLIAVFAPINSRNPLYDAMYRQNFYATSGTRILLYPQNLNQPFPLQIHGTHELFCADIFRFYPDGTEKMERIDLRGRLDATIESPEDPQAKAFYIRITQRDGEKAWIGPWFH
jgi:predicted DNA-binding protein (MmcQ/YjbR family)